MPSRGSSGIAVYMAWDTSANAYKTGDSANHTLRFVKDGVSAAPTNSPAEVDSTNAPGAYSISWTSAEGTVNILWIGGKSSTSNIYLIPITIGFENLPVLPTQILASASGVNVTQWLGSAPNILQNGLVQVAIVSGAASSVLGSVASVTSGVNVTQILGSVVVTSAAQLGVNVVAWEGGTPAPLAGSGNNLVQTTVSGGVAASTNVTQWQGVSVAPLIGGLVQAAVSGTPGVNVTQWTGTAVALDAANLPSVGATDIAGIAAVTSLALGNTNVVTIGGVLAQTSLASAQVNLVSWRGTLPNVLQNGLVQAATVSGAATSVIGNVGGNVAGSVNSVTTTVTANVTQVQGGTINNLISGRVDVTLGQSQPNSIQTGTFNAAALATTVFASNFLTSALVDTTQNNAAADALLDRANAIETGHTPRQSLRLASAANGGQLSGAGTSAVGIWGAGVTTTRISATTSQSGNRQAVTLNL